VPQIWHAAPQSQEPMELESSVGKRGSLGDYYTPEGTSQNRMIPNWQRTQSSRDTQLPTVASESLSDSPNNENV
jgi:hypothetical protein